MRGSGQTRPEGGADATLGPARPAAQRAFAGYRPWPTIATSTIGSS